jgi:hypothetical protein
MRRSADLRPALVSLIVLVACPANALAAPETFCVQDPDCTGNAQPTVAAALAAAQANGTERDLIQIGPGTFSSGATLTDASDNPVDIRGAGPSATVLTRPAAAGQYVLFLSNAASTVSSLDLHLQAGLNGLRLANGASGDLLRVSAVPAVSGSTGVSMNSGGTLRRSVVTLPTSASNTGVAAGFSATLDADGISATTGVAASGSGAQLTGLRITAHVGVVLAGGIGAYDASVDNTQVQNLSAISGDAGLKVTGSQSNDTTATLTARHVTLLGPGSGAGLRSEANSSTNNTHSNLDVRDTLVRGYGFDLSVEELSSDNASIVIDTSAYDFTKTSANPGAEITTGPKNLNLNGADPRLRDFSGDMRPGFDSPLVDRATAGGLLPAESQVDLARLPRLVDGNGDGTATRDIGAFEYQRSAPRVSASAAPGAAAIGEPITFAATATDSDPEETTTISWSFDDGTSAAGDSVQHAFATPGPHSATATAVDPAGVTGSAGATVTISAPATATPPDPDRLAPALTIGNGAVKLTRNGVARIPLTCPATETSGPCQGKLTLTTQRKVRATRRAKAKKVKLGSVSFSVPAGSTTKVNLKLSNASRKLVARLKRLPVSGAATVHDQVGNAGVAAATFKVLAPATVKRKRR